MHRSRGFTLIELLLVIAIIGILSSIATVGFVHAKVRGAEVSAVASLHAINTAQLAYLQTCGNERYYAPTLVSLAAPVPGSGAGFLSPDLALSDPLTKSGYVFSLTATQVPDAEPACSGAVPASGYSVTADPVTVGVTGKRYFATNADRVIFEGTETFSGNMPETGPPARGQEVK